MFQNAHIVCIGTDDREYHAEQKAERGSPEFVMSCGALREFAYCPSRWRSGYVAPDSEAKQDGSLFDCLLLTPKHFNKRYVVKPSSYTNAKGEDKPWNGNSNTCKAWIEEHASQIITTRDAVAECRRAIERLKADEVASAWLDCCDTQVWIAAEWHDKATGVKLPFKSLIDFVPQREKETTISFASSLGDLKRTRNCSLPSWQRWCYQAGYHIAAALYTDIFNATLTPDERPRETFCFILSENYPPYEPGKRILAQEFQELGRASYQRMLSDYCQCVKSGKFPGYDDNDEALSGWSLVVPSPWQAMAEQFAPHYSFGDAPAPEPREPFVSETPS